MMYFLNILDDIAESNAIFTILIVTLIVISLSSLYLIYTQNKMNAKNVNKNYTDNNENSKQISVVEELVSSNLDSMSDLNNISYTNEDVDNSLNDLQRLNDTVLSDNDITNQVVSEPNMDSFMKMKEEKNDSVSEIDSFDLEDVTRELEAIPRERTINLTPFEAAQEESAIISYDELINRVEKNNNVSYNNVDSVNDVNMTTNVMVEEKINTDNSIEHELNSSVTGYEHEEAFLDALKQLQKLLN